MRLSSVAILALLLFNCLTRDNYWDPLNYTTVLQRTMLDSVLAGYNSLSLGELSALRSKLSADSAENAQRRISNNSIKAENVRKGQYNDTVQAENSLLQPPQINYRIKELLDTLFLLMLTDTGAHLDSLAGRVTSEKSRADSMITSVNERSNPIVIFTPKQRDSILGLFDSILSLISGIQAAGVGMYTEANTANTDTIIPYNDSIRNVNAGVRLYNDSIRLYFASKILDHPDSIIAHLKTAKRGQTFVIDTGFYDSLVITFDNSGTIDSPIVVQGLGTSPNDSIRISYSSLILDNNSFIIFNNIQFTASDTPGVIIQNGCTGIVFNTCMFSSSNKALTIFSSDVTMNDCVVARGTEGIFISSSLDQSKTVLLNNILIKNCGGNAVTVTGTNLTVQNATIAQNGSGEALYLYNPAASISVRNSIIATTGAASANPAIYFEGGYTGAYPFTMSNVNMFENGQDQDTVNAPVTEPVLHYNPMFDYDDFSISPDSPLDSLEKAGIVIGYRKK